MFIQQKILLPCFLTNRFKRILSDTVISCNQKLHTKQHKVTHKDTQCLPCAVVYQINIMHVQSCCVSATNCHWQDYLLMKYSRYYLQHVPWNIHIEFHSKVLFHWNKCIDMVYLLSSLLHVFLDVVCILLAQCCIIQCLEKCYVSFNL